MMAQPWSRGVSNIKVRVLFMNRLSQTEFVVAIYLM